MRATTTRPIPVATTIAMLLALLGLVVAALVWSSSAPAAFPGKDGRILVSSDRDGNFEIW